MLLHRNLDKQHLKSVSLYRLVEDQAHRFASSFLLPADSFARSVGSRTTLNELLTMKNDWLVSVGAMVKRCETLGLISPDSARTLWINYLKRGWKQHEPLDDLLVIKPPRMLADAIAALRETDEVLFRAWASTVVQDVPPNDVAEISGTPEGWYRPNQISAPRFGVRIQAV